MNIPYIKNDTTYTIETIIDVYSNMEKFIELDLVDFPSERYEDNCVSMCNISTFTIGGQLLDLCEPGQLIVHEGVFAMHGNHTWLEIEGVIIDATLCQFVENAKHLSLIDASWDQYYSVKQYKFEDWIEQSNNVA